MDNTASLLDRKRFKNFKWVEVISTEGEAVKHDALYLLETDGIYCKAIVVDSNGNKRIIGSASTPANGKSAYEIWLELGNTGSKIDFLNDLAQFNSMTLSVIDGELIIENYEGDSAELIDGELILN